jgi:hypothetical protein
LPWAKPLGPEAGLAELRKIPDPAKLKDYPFYAAAMGEFQLLVGRPAEAGKHFEQAMKLGRSRSETNFFEGKLEAWRLVPLKLMIVDDSYEKESFCVRMGPWQETLWVWTE